MFWVRRASLAVRAAREPFLSGTGRKAAPIPFTRRSLSVCQKRTRWESQDRIPVWVNQKCHGPWKADKSAICLVRTWRFVRHWLAHGAFALFLSAFRLTCREGCWAGTCTSAWAASGAEGGGSQSCRGQGPGSQHQGASGSTTAHNCCFPANLNVLGRSGPSCPGGKWIYPSTWSGHPLNNFTGPWYSMVWDQQPHEVGSFPINTGIMFALVWPRNSG